jgi:hypothetical protein
MLINLLALCVIILKAPFLILKFFFKHRALLVVAIVAVIAFGAYHTITGNRQQEKAVAVPYYQQIEPAKNLAPRVIQTIAPDRVYYVSDFKDDGKTITLTSNKYYMYNKEKWELGVIPLPLDRDNYRDIVIYVR